MIVPRKSAIANSEFNSPQFDEEFDLSKLWLCVARHRVLVVFVVILGILLGSGAGFYRSKITPQWYASSKLAGQGATGATGATGGLGGVGAEPVSRELLPWRESEELKRSLEKSLSYPVLSKWLLSFELEVLNVQGLQEADLSIPISLRRRVRVRTAEGDEMVLKFLIKYTGRLNELPAMIQVDATRLESASRLLEAWAAGVNADLEQKRMPLIENATRVGGELKSVYENAAAAKPKMPSFAEARGGTILGGGDLSNPPSAPISLGGFIEADPKMGSVETALRVLDLIKKTPVIQPLVPVLDKGASSLKQVASGGAVGLFLGLGLLGGGFLLQSLKSDKLETEQELATIFPESAVLKMGRTQALKDVSKTVLWAAWVQSGNNKPGELRDFVLWQTGGGENEALSEVLIQEYRTHYVGAEIYRAASASEAEARRALRVASLSAPVSLKVLAESVSAESLRKVHLSEKVALVINEPEPSLAEWKQNAAALEFSGIRPQLVILLS